MTNNKAPDSNTDFYNSQPNDAKAFIWYRANNPVLLGTPPASFIWIAIKSAWLR